MKKYLLGLLLVPSLLLNAQDAIKRQNVVIYNQNIGVVREIREMDIKKGDNIYSITNIPNAIDPTSVKIKLDGEVLEQNYKYDIASVSKILNKYINKDILLIGKNTINGKLLSVNDGGLVIEKKDGGLMLINDIKEYQISVSDLPKGFVTQPTLDWLISASKDKKQDVEITYQTAGLNWHTEYVALLNDNDDAMDLNAWVSLDNQSGMTYKDADLMLIAGNINRATTENYPRQYKSEDMAYSVRASGVTEAPIFEYHSYQLNKPTTIANNEIKQVSMFDAANIKVKKEYVFRSGNRVDNGHPNVYINFENSEKNNLGIPMPMGKISIFKKSDKGNILLGEDKINHTPKNETLTLEVGEAFDIVIDDIVKDTKVISDNYTEFTVEIEIRNRKNEDVEIQVNHGVWGDVVLLDSNFKLLKKDANTLIFKVPVKKESTQKLTFRYGIKR